MDEQRLDAIKEIKGLIENLRKNESVGLDIEGVEELTVDNYRSRGYDKGAKIRDTKTAYLGKVNIKRKSDSEELIPILEGLVETLDKDRKTDTGKIRSILEKLAPYTGYANLVLNILTKAHLI